jgi:hypothetical protein
MPVWTGDSMIWGLVYAYYDKKGHVVYVGKTIGPYTIKSVLTTRHSNHLLGKTPFDIILKRNPRRFQLRMIGLLYGTKAEIWYELKELEKFLIKTLQPKHNVFLLDRGHS